ncbi:MAG: tyrosine-type recombinase/integrase [Desulfuromonadaceae bacterium]|nr:tyrosine-type recombinase/integrase [Desulfuromonadaceae bacterium]MDD2848647.1 tyrosine-type recombinase/integrase [Desulfuromonadaceae bacterium]MDD4130850.1 tyrosine-type recombinase/integrase [Desulfuromonadaceae bacterium]
MTLGSGNIVVDLKKWLVLYLQEVSNKNLSPRTLEIYKGILEGFIEYSRGYQDEAGIEDINRLFLNGYLADKENNSKNFSASSKKLYVTVLKTFFSFLTENNSNNHDFEKIFKKMKIKVEQKEKPSLSEDEITKILNFFEKEKKSSINRLIKYRNVLLCKVLLYGGLRVSELLTFRICDFKFDPENNVYGMLVTGKGAKQRFAYVPAEMIAEELEVLREGKGEAWGICTTRNGTVINRSNLWTIISGMFRRAGVDQRGLHILRHTFARRLVNNNVNLKTISELLGHADVSITAKFYAKSNEGAKRAAVRSV